MSVIGAANAPARVGRNDPCPCGSGKKFKHCCQSKDQSAPLSAEWPKGPPPAARKRRLQELAIAAKAHWRAERWVETIPPLREIAQLEPDSARAHHDLGAAYLRAGRLSEAAASLRRALELRPSFEGALRELAYTLEQDGREAEAAAAWRRLSRTAADPIERRHFAGKALVMERKLAEAETEFLRVLAQSPRRADIRILLAHLLSSRGEFDEAAIHLTQAIEDSPRAFQQLTEAKRLTEADRPLVDRMRGAAEQPGLDAASRIAVHFGLGKAFDDLGDYAGAMRHYEEANRLKAISLRLDRRALTAQFDKFVTTFTAEALAGLRQSLARPERPGDDLPVFIVGMPRSGTTLVEQILSSHPYVATGGELNFWNERLTDWRLTGIDSVEPSAVARAAEDYRTLLRRFGPQAARVIDKAPGNFERLWLIRLAFPEARVIHCRRHPVDTCLSNFFTNFFGRFDYAWNRGDLVFYYRQYMRLMDHWRSVLPGDYFTEVNYETLVADREAETRRLVAFCGLAWDDACLAPERNERAVKTASVWQARQPVYKTSVERWRRYAPWLGELRELLSPEEARG